jgi:hypothetical protein
MFMMLDYSIMCFYNRTATKKVGVGRGMLLQPAVTCTAVCKHKVVRCQPLLDPVAHLVGCALGVLPARVATRE